MIQPIELKLQLPIVLSNDVISTTGKVWEILVASYEGNLQKIKAIAKECPELLYAQYNYTPPIHFAVREGHVDLVNYLLSKGAHDPTYKIYPFQDSLVTIANDRGHTEIVNLLEEFNNNPALHKFKGDNGEIRYNRTPLELEFEKTVNDGKYNKSKEILEAHPEFALDDTFFWSEGVMMMVAKGGNFELVKLLMSYGSKVPSILKWGQFYYFENYEMTKFLLENRMNPNVMSWHHVTLLHDMAQKGDIQKIELFVKHGANIDAVEEEYQSTPLGMAARWGHQEAVKVLLKNGADPNKSGASWSTPLIWAKAKGHNEIQQILVESGAV